MTINRYTSLAKSALTRSCVLIALVFTLGFSSSAFAAMQSVTGLEVNYYGTEQIGLKWDHLTGQSSFDVYFFHTPGTYYPSSGSGPGYFEYVQSFDGSSTDGVQITSSIAANTGYTIAVLARTSGEPLWMAIDENLYSEVWTAHYLTIGVLPPYTITEFNQPLDSLDEVEVTTNNGAILDGAYMDGYQHVDEDGTYLEWYDLELGTHVTYAIYQSVTTDLGSDFVLFDTVYNSTSYLVEDETDSHYYAIAAFFKDSYSLCIPSVIHIDTAYGDWIAGWDELLGS